MRTFKCVICLLLCAATAHAETILSFSAEIEDESLAEDAILLAHCLSERTGHGWEFMSEPRGPFWLKLREENRGVTGTYHKDGKDLSVSMKAGESDEACDKLEPNGRALPSLGLPQPEANAPLRLSPMSETAPSEESSHKGWIWAAAAGLAVLGGVLFWRSRQPAFSSIQMK